ncbi:MAG: nitrilase-related carbon-nitrogen hydrolase [Patescibacteria group bacterium]
MSIHTPFVRRCATSPLIQVVSAGILASSGLLVPTLFPFSIIGAATYLYILWSRPHSLAALLGYGLLFGVLTSAAGLIWFFDTLPLAWMGVPEGTEYLLVSITWVAASFALALPHAVGAYVLSLLRTSPYAPLGAALLWGGVEVVRTWSFALLVLAPESVLNSYFSITSLGYALTEQPHLLQFARLGGFHALNIAFGLSAGSIAALCIPHRAMRQTGIIALLTLLLLPFFLYAPMNTHTNTLRVGLVATDIHAGVAPTADSFASIHTILASPTTPLDMLVFPEGYGLNGSPLTYPGELLVIGSHYASSTDQTGYGTLTYWSSTEGLLGTHQKTLLVPLGEYLPPVLRTLFFLSHSTELTDYLKDHYERVTRRGSRTEVISFGTTRIAALLCSEILSPSLYHSLVRDQGADVLINVANNAWFHGSRLVHRRLTQLAKVHAVYTQRYFLVSANASPSYAVTPRGTIIAETPWGANAVLVVEIPIP